MLEELYIFLCLFVLGGILYGSPNTATVSRDQAVYISVALHRERKVVQAMNSRASVLMVSFAAILAPSDAFLVPSLNVGLKSITASRYPCQSSCRPRYETQILCKCLR